MNSISRPLEIVELATRDGEVIIVRRHGNPSGPRILDSHGNGLASDLYFPLWSRLLDQFDLFVYTTSGITDGTLWAIDCITQFPTSCKIANSSQRP